jgi:hypothetical protein
MWLGCLERVLHWLSEIVEEILDLSRVAAFGS